ncbi:MAG: hypothetical protein GXN93_04640 [Candidatus Diapherotrites archaeon]|nr:hypothetical protein [Candidatus Diapherotrites archaeon]
MRLTLFADAHIHDATAAELVSRFLDEKSDVIFLGDMFDSPEDADRYWGFIRRYDFTWIKGNHDYWMDLPESLCLDDGTMLTHGHKLLVTWLFEQYLVKYTPAARKFGVFGPTMAFGRFFRDSIFERAFGSAVLHLSAHSAAPAPLVIMGHLHHYLRAGPFVVLPRFPKYAVYRDGVVEIRNYLDEI